MRGTGVEIMEEKVYDAVGTGLSVFHGEIDEGLSDYPAGMFDYVILSQTLQQARETVLIMQEALRVARYLIVGLPNFAYRSARFQLMFTGRTRTKNLLTNGITPQHPQREHKGLPHLHTACVLYAPSTRQGQVRLCPFRCPHGVFVLELV